MVQADISQLSEECNTWRETLRSFREELNRSKQNLQSIAGQPLSKDQLQDVEHYHNQFHIQLINIHDLKQAIKAHDRRVNFEVAANNGQLNDDTVHDHEKLYDDYVSLEHTLSDLRDEFKRFVDRSN
jgi:chromosome segregation ATPase